MSGPGSGSRDQIFHSEIPAETGTKAKLTADHYLISNERRIELFHPYLKNLGGGYIGVGSDQNLTLLAWARSEYVWLMDFDVYVVRVNKMHLALLKHCENYVCFKDLWQPTNKEKTWEIIQKKYNTENDFKEYRKSFDLAMNASYGVHSRLSELEYMTQKFNFRSFHNDPSDYNYLRDLALKDRIKTVKGDLKNNGTFRSIAKKTKEMNIAIRVVYTSNAEEYFRFPKEYRENILSIPTDEAGYFVRTFTNGARGVLGFPNGEKYPNEYPFHYNLQKLENMKIWMSFQYNFTPVSLLKGRTQVSKGFSIQNSTPAEQGFIETGKIDN
ncbi:hypothetical protein P3G55_15675 [Leptospira sp. 96542]|nr:hypothetical protein [Leptospira sp. 96542]